MDAEPIVPDMLLGAAEVAARDTSAPTSFVAEHDGVVPRSDRHEFACEFWD